ncbi:MAG: hypothetical protein KBT34_10750 [Prevotella sp.]|nr:hypothetical protein [Candidatus Prevotella equi]
MASFLIGCNSYKEPIDEKKLYELAMDSMEDYKKDILRFRVPTFCQSYEDGYIAGYRKAWEDKQ